MQSTARPSKRRTDRALRPLVSVIVPTYNRANYLPHAIDSVLTQSYPNVELIVVDDGSTDDTIGVVERYGRRVTLVRTGNGGVAHARNAGVLASSGEYLAFLDSDDLLYPYMIELEARILERHPHIAMVYAEMTGFDDEGFFEPYHLKEYHRSAYRHPRVTYDRIFRGSAELSTLGPLPPALLAEFPSAAARRVYFGNIFDSYVTGLVVFQNNMLMRRSLLPEVGLRREHLRYWEEVDYILRITRDHAVAFVDVPTYKLRYHDGQISGTTGDRWRYVWARKQQCLLHTVKRHALEDRGYYDRHKPQLDRHLAHLHRAAAVPLMVGDGSRPRTRDLARRARLYLSRAANYGRVFPLLWMLTFCPVEVRRIGAGVIESIGDLKQRWTSTRSPRPARQAPPAVPARAELDAPSSDHRSGVKS